MTVPRIKGLATDLAVVSVGIAVLLDSHSPRVIVEISKAGSRREEAACTVRRTNIIQRG